MAGALFVGHTQWVTCRVYTLQRRGPETPLTSSTSEYPCLQALTRQIMFLASEAVGVGSIACLPPTHIKAGYLGCGSGVQSHAAGAK